MNKRFLLLFSALVIAGGFWGYKLFFAKSDDIVLNGNVEVQDVNLAFRVAGRVDTINVDEGAQVKCGDLLATLDKDIFKAKVKYAKAQVDGAAVSLSNAKKDFKRNTDLLRKHSISEKVYDAAKTEYEVALSKMDSAKAMCEYMEIDLNDADLVSPVDGVVLTRNIECGEMVSAGTVVFSIMPNNQTKVKTFASEDVLSRINHGDVVYVNIETMPEKKFVGHIGFISSEAEFTPKNIETKELRTSLMYRIRVIIDEPAPELKQGMPVTVSYTK
ncbi:MAG: efflux RND transporter periplasmic adaptor subunit [Alphaproteobacteria bacterium]|nr:efflux RND transporter periplasmic adaptor subunit [Alphaproteobacteria bacterium]